MTRQPTAEPSLQATGHEVDVVVDDQEVLRVDLEEPLRGSDRLARDVHVRLGFQDPDAQPLEPGLGQLAVELRAKDTVVPARKLVGEPAGVKEGGVLSQVSREINVEALPMEIPDHLELDVSGMGIGDTLRLVDLPAQEGVTYLDDPEDTVLASVQVPAVIVEPEPEEEELEEGEEGAELEEGEEAPEGEEGAEPTAEGEAAGGEDQQAEES